MSLFRHHGEPMPGWEMLPGRWEPRDVDRLLTRPLQAAPLSDRFVFLTGCSRGAKWVSRLSHFGMGRMMVDRISRAYPGERWGFDNGMFPAWKNRVPWSKEEYRLKLRVAQQVAHPPYMAVIPDLPASPNSLHYSIAWMFLELVNVPFRWYLPVQNGMTPDSTDFQTRIPSYFQPYFHGIFLGGTDDYKQELAGAWCDWAHAHGKLFHYARAGTIEKLEHALATGADSADSALILWEEERFEDFVYYLRERERRPAGVRILPEWQPHVDRSQLALL